MTTFTTTRSNAFTMTHARHIASKVATDLHRFHRFYGRPSLERIERLKTEVAVLMEFDAIDEVTYGFMKDGEWITAVKYRSVDGSLISNDIPGSIRAGFDVDGATFYSFMCFSPAWFQLSQSERDRIEAEIPFSRSSGNEPTVKDGYWHQDLGYSAGGRGLQRSSIRRY